MIYAKKSGFTLIEILIALFIVAILAGGVAYYVPGYIDKAKTRRARIDLKVISSGIIEYNVDIGQYPQRLKDLVKQPQDDQAAAGKWQKGGYIQGKKDVPQDPWGNKFQYKLTPGEDHPYELFSYGSGGKGSPKNEHISVWKD